MRALADRVRVVLALLGPLGAGSRVLLLRLLGRWGFWWVLGGAAVVAYAAIRYRTWIVWMLTAWSAAAWMHAPAEEDAADEPTEAEEEPPIEAPPDPLPGILETLIGEAPGVHIKSIVQYLHKERLDTACTAADVTAALGRRGIPIRPSVRDAAGRVNRGVHRADLEAWMGIVSPTAPVPLSKTRSNPVAAPVTSNVAAPATGVATPPTAHE